MFEGDRVVTEKDGQWLSRPSAIAYETSLMEIVGSSQRDVASAILEVCVHTLSADRKGATIVWFPEGVPTVRNYEDHTAAIAPPSLSAAIPSHGRAIAHALGQMDRAAVLNADGRISDLNVTLDHADAHAESVFDGGTRHNSAGGFSASVPDAIVFVVSTPRRLQTRGALLGILR